MSEWVIIVGNAPNAKKSNTFRTPLTLEIHIHKRLLMYLVNQTYLTKVIISNLVFSFLENTYGFLQIILISCSLHLKSTYTTSWFSRSIVMINYSPFFYFFFRCKKEDNMAVIFMGFILVFLVCHLPRLLLNIHELATIR